MKTLYLSDLDGTLLNNDSRLSSYAAQTLSRLVSEGMLFTYATARSLSSALNVTAGFLPSLPMIAYNGACIFDTSTGKRLVSYSLEKNLLEDAIAYLSPLGVYPLVYSIIEGAEKVSWLRGKENAGIERYLRLREGDKRLRAAETEAELYAGEIFYITCIGSLEEMKPINARFAAMDGCNCTLQAERYPIEWWCEIMPSQATKGNAALRLKEMLSCDRIVAFGDAVNDLPLFAIADESYAVQNAVGELKAAATGVIAPNGEDGVVRWLEERQRRGNP